MPTLKSILIFFFAGICEIGGGYLVWLWFKDGKSMWYGVLGGILLAFYGVVASMQPPGFGRTYATYGGIFIVMSLIAAYKLDNFVPDRYNLIGAFIALIDVCVIYFAPRN